MNKKHFFEMDVHKRAKQINEMLKTKSMNEIAKSIGISASAFSKEMQNGDYVFIKRENQYFHFIREEQTINHGQDTEAKEVIDFIKVNFGELQTLIANYKGDRIDLNPKVYDDSSELLTKSIRVRDNVYKEFQSYCQENYPYFSMQDLIAHCLIEFTNKRISN